VMAAQLPEEEEECLLLLLGMQLESEGAPPQMRRRPNDKARRKKKSAQEAALAAQAKVAAQELGAARAQRLMEEEAGEGETWKDVYHHLLHGPAGGEGGDAGGAEVNQPELHIDEESSWTLVPALDPARMETARQREAATPALPAHHRQRSQANWDRFYQSNTTNFFKDRHYLHHQFSELLPSEEERTILEYGCGVGNTVLPLMKTQPRARFIAMDFSHTAIRLLQTHPDFEAGRCTAFVSDLTKDDLPPSIPPDSIDIILLIFVMSALAPEHMLTVLTKLHRVLKPGGVILFRDYGKYDMAQLRFLSRKNPNKIDDCMYVRWDGTTSYFFSLEELRELFGKAELREEESKLDTRELKNRKRKLVMFRVWVNSRFCKLPQEDSSNQN